MHGYGRAWGCGLLLQLATAGPAPAQNFVEVAEAVGIEHYALDPRGMAGGVAVFDYDRDGFQDIYLIGGSAADRLYRNRGDGSFEDVSKATRISALASVATSGVATGDVDGDGFVDLFVTTGPGERNYLLKNLDGRTFADVSLAAGVGLIAWSTSAAMSDVDLDGDLDLFVANFVTYDALPYAQHIIAPQANVLYLNDGGGRFRPAPEVYTDERPGCTLATAFSDVDRDGRPELFVLNDFGDFYVANQLYRLADTSLRYVEIGGDVGFVAAINCMGIASGDFDADQRPGYYLTNIGTNLLYRTDGSARFEEGGRYRGVAVEQGVSWGAASFDADNDGHLDLAVARGSLVVGDWHQDNLLFLGRGRGGPFVASPLDLFSERVNRGRGLATVDFDNDGALDVVVANLRMSEEEEARTCLYHNRGPSQGNWLSIGLRGRRSNRDGVGAVVTVYSDSLTIVRELVGGGSYLSAGPSVLHFGLGASPHVDSVAITWPRAGHNREVLFGLRPNEQYTIVEDSAVFVRRTASVSTCEALTATGQRLDHGAVYTQTIRGERLDTQRTFRIMLRDSVDALCAGATPPADQLAVGPNPFADQLSFTLPPGHDPLLRAALYGLGGRLLRSAALEGTASGETVTFDDLSSLGAGPYVLRLVSVSGVTSYRVVHY